jgi:NAD(P)H dehydrogenase (quinone)
VIAVTGATGGVGSRVLAHLIARADPPPVVALARRPDAAPAAPGLTVRHADYDDPASLRAAMRGVDTLVFVSSDGVVETMRRHHAHVVAAAVEVGVGHVVYTGIIDTAPDSGFYYAPAHRETEAQLAASGLDVCLARTSIFADFFVATWIEPAGGTLAVPAGAGGMSLVTRDDVARALAVAAAERRTGVLDLTGPAALTAAEIARITGIRHHAIEDPGYRAQLAREEAPGWLVEAFTSMFAAVRDGRFALVSDDGPRLTGVPARSYADFLREG